MTLASWKRQSVYGGGLIDTSHLEGLEKGGGSVVPAVHTDYGALRNRLPATGQLGARCVCLTTSRTSRGVSVVSVHASTTKEYLYCQTYGGDSNIAADEGSIPVWPIVASVVCHYTMCIQDYRSLV